MRISLVLLCALVLAFPGVVRAQRISDLPIGARVRVETGSARVIGKLENVSADSVKVRTNLDLRAFALSDAKSVWVSTGPGRGHGMLKAGVPAGVIGALAGAGLSYLTWEKCKPGHIVQCAYVPSTRGKATVFGGAAIGAVSFVIGSAVGAIAGSETWSRVSLQ